MGSMGEALRGRPLVLMVEDDDLFAGELGAFLLTQGCEVERVVDGSSALLRLRSHPPPRLVLLDLLLPGVDGWHFYAELRSQPQLPQVPIVVLTGAGRAESTGLRGIAGFLRKPTEEAGLVPFRAALRAHLEEWVFPPKTLRR